MKNIPILYGIIVILGALLAFSYTGVCKRSSNLIPTSEILKKLEANSAHGAILFNTNGDLSLIDVRGNPALSCKFPGQIGKGKVCRGFNGGELLDVKPISLIKTKGSICYSIVTSSGGLLQICY